MREGGRERRGKGEREGIACLWAWPVMYYIILLIVGVVFTCADLLLPLENC